MSRRVLVMVVALAGLVAPGATATAATRTSISLTAHVQVPPGGLVALPALVGEPVVLKGGVTAGPGRVVVLQRLIAGHWSEVSRRAVVGGSYRFVVTAGHSGGYVYRSVALRTATASRAVSRARLVTVVATKVVLSAPARAAAGSLVTFSGSAGPVLRSGQRVELHELMAGRWTAVASAPLDVRGRFTVRQLGEAAGAHRFRAVVRSAGYGPVVATTSKSRLVLNTRAAAGKRTTSLASVTPLTSGGVAGSYATGPVTVRGRIFPRSVRFISETVSYRLGAGVSTVGTALTLLPGRHDGILLTGDELVGVRVDGALRLRRFLRRGQVLPLTLNVRGKHVVSITRTQGPLDLGVGADVVLLRPVATTVALAERGVDTTTALSELAPVATSGPVRTNQVFGFASRTVYGGSVYLAADNQAASTTGWLDYDLAGRYRRLRGAPGIVLEAPTVTGSVTVIGDGHLLATWTAPLSNTTPVRSVDVTGVHRLRIQLDAPDVSSQFWAFQWGVALQDPRLSR